MKPLASELSTVTIATWPAVEPYASEKKPTRLNTLIDRASGTIEPGGADRLRARASVENRIATAVR